MRTVLLGVLLVAFGAITSLAAPDTVPTSGDIAGVYSCEGHNPDGTDRKSTRLNSSH